MVVKDRIAKRPCRKTCVRDVLREFPLSREVRHVSTVYCENSPFNRIGRLNGTWISIIGNDVMAMSWKQEQRLRNHNHTYISFNVWKSKARKFDLFVHPRPLSGAARFVKIGQWVVKGLKAARGEIRMSFQSIT